MSHLDHEHTEDFGPMEPFTAETPDGREVLVLDGVFELSAPSDPTIVSRFRAPTLRHAQLVRRRLAAAIGGPVQLAIHTSDTVDTTVMARAAASSPLDDLAVDWIDPDGEWTT